MTELHDLSSLYPKPLYAAPKEDLNTAWYLARVSSLRIGICWLNPREIEHTNSFLEKLEFLLPSGSSQNLGVPEDIYSVPAGVGRVLRVGGAAPRCVGGSLGGLRGELAKGRWGVLSAAGEACVLGAGGAIARSAHHSSACWVGSCVRGAAAGFSLTRKNGAWRKENG